MEKLANYIDGQLVAPQSGAYLDNIEPATGKVYSLIPDSDQEDINRAVAAAKKAFPGWSALPAEKRSDYLLAISRGIADKMDLFAEAESRDNGKPLSLARKVDIPRAVTNFRFFGEAINHTASESHPMGHSVINYTLRDPLGVVACISPWNLPLYLFSWKIAPALATGNTVVAKPSEITPMTAFMLSEVCREAGLPPGVLNIVHGAGPKTGAHLNVHPEIKAISFTGGTTTGKLIAQQAAPLFKKLSLEMGGKNPNIIFADCSYEEMLETTILSSFGNQGQICLCGSRIFIEASLYDRFKKDFIERTEQLRVGDPLENVNLGAIVSRAHRDKIMGYIRLAREEGGTILTGGDTVQPGGRCAEGYFIAPTIIEGLPHDCRTNMEEIFGPVVTIMPFEKEEEVISYANVVEYGLSSTIWTNDLKRAHRVASQIESGIVWVNCWLVRDLRTPFGGMKNSGVGREGGEEVMRFFTEPKNVCIKYN